MTSDKLPGQRLLLFLALMGLAAESKAAFRIENATQRGCLSRSEPQEIEQPLSILLTNALQSWQKDPKNQRRLNDANADPLSNLYIQPIMPMAEGNPRFSFKLRKPEPTPENPEPKFEMENRDGMIEAYWRPHETTYRLVPGLGIGASTDTRTWIYFCLYLPDSDEGNEMVIHFLNADYDVRSSEVKVKSKYINLEVDPVGGLFSLLLGPALALAPQSTTELSEFDESRIFKKNVSLTAEILSPFLGLVGKVGVNRVEITPTRLKLSLRKKVLVLIEDKSDSARDFNSTWMIKAKNQKRVFEKKSRR